MVTKMVEGGAQFRNRRNLEKIFAQRKTKTMSPSPEGLSSSSRKKKSIVSEKQLKHK